MIYEAYYQVTIRNTGALEKVLRDVHLVAIVGGKRFAMVISYTDEMGMVTWESVNTVEGKSHWAGVGKT